jgi:hypothetical protein
MQCLSRPTTVYIKRDLARTVTGLYHTHQLVTMRGDTQQKPFQIFQAFLAVSNALGFLAWYTDRWCNHCVLNHFWGQFKIPIIPCRISDVLQFGRTPGEQAARTPIHDPDALDRRLSQDRAIGIIATGTGRHYFFSPFCFCISEINFLCHFSEVGGGSIRRVFSPRTSGGCGMVASRISL